MKKRIDRIWRLNKICLFLFLPNYYYSCSPIIQSFEITDTKNNITQTIISEDSLLIKWKVCGEPTLLFHEEQVIDSSNVQLNDCSVKYLEFTLIAKKGNKQERRMIQVTQLPKESIDAIIFTAKYNEGHDTLVAIDEKNSKRWGDNFRILTVASSSGREIIVKHEGITTKLDKEGTPTNDLTGTSVKGIWELRSPISEFEKKNPSALPESLEVKTTIQYKKN